MNYILAGNNHWLFCFKIMSYILAGSLKTIKKEMKRKDYANKVTPVCMN